MAVCALHANCYTLLHGRPSIVDRTAADIRRESRFLPTTTAFDAPLGSPCRNIAITFGMEKLERRGYPKVKNFDRIHERDGRTDGYRAMA